MKRTKLLNADDHNTTTVADDWFGSLGRLESELSIDRHALDECLEKQPMLFYEVSKMLALTISQRDEAKQNLIMAESKADIKIRREAVNTGDKVTEREIDANKRLSPRVEEATASLNILQKNLHIVAGLKDAFEQRSRALKDMCGLYVSNYYSTASTGGASHQLKESHGEDAREAMASKRRKL